MTIMNLARVKLRWKPRSGAEIRIILCLCVLFLAQAGTGGPAGSRFDEVMQTIRTGNAYQRAEAVAVVAWIDDPRVVPVMLGLLEDEDGRVRGDAAQQLVRLADKSHADALAKALRDTSRNVRYYAAEALARIGDERHVSALVASVIDHLPDPNTDEYESRSCGPALQAIGKLSPKAPAELVHLIRTTAEQQDTYEEDWWRLIEETAKCLGQIKDKAARDALMQINDVLGTGGQDYRAWYAVRKALAAIEPEAMRFDSPAADILVTVRRGKITRDYQDRQWVQPVVAIGTDAVEDIAWVLKFENEWDDDRRQIAVESLGEIGGSSAAGVLRQYIQRRSNIIKRERRGRDYLVIGLVALLKAEPNDRTAREVVEGLGLLSSSEHQNVVYGISNTPERKVPAEIKGAVYQGILLASGRLKSVDQHASWAAAKSLSQMGGQQAGAMLSKILLETPSADTAQAAAMALGTIKGYDPIPSLVKAAELPRAPVGAIAEAIGTRNDPLGLPAIEGMARREILSQTDRLWLAAASARLGRDYQSSASFVRSALPRSLRQAAWLTDTETIDSICRLIVTDVNLADEASQVLEQMNTPEALKRGLAALASLIDIEAPDEPRRVEVISSLAARMAEKLQDESKQQYADIAVVARSVRGWFEMGQQSMPEPQDRPNYDVVKQYPDLARKLWIEEAIRRLDLLAKRDKEDWQSIIHDSALRPIQDIYDPELVPVLERIAAESRAQVEFHGKYQLVEFYSVRSIAARILTEKTGRPHTFADVDGRRHPGGWNPSQEE